MRTEQEIERAVELMESLGKSRLCGMTPSCIAASLRWALGQDETMTGSFGELLQALKQAAEPLH